MKHGANPNILNEAGHTIFHIAAEYDKPQGIYYLKSKHSVEIDLKDEDGKTALHVAASKDFI